MRLLTCVFLLCLTFAFISCDDDHETKGKSVIVQNVSASSQDIAIKFKRFISKFRLISLPYTINTDCFSPSKSLYRTFNSQNDSLFIKETNHNIALGLLPDTSNFFAVIYCAPATCYIPTLATYSKNGQLLSEEQIGNGCGADCGYTCFDYVKINSLEDIVLVNSIEMFECDSLAQETPGTWEKTVEIKRISLNNKGKITASVSQTKETR